MKLHKRFGPIVTLAAGIITCEKKSFPITFHQMKIVHSITKDDKTWKKVLYNHSLSNLPIAQNKIKFMKKMHQSNFVN